MSTLVTQKSTLTSKNKLAEYYAEVTIAEQSYGKRTFNVPFTTVRGTHILQYQY